MFEVQSKKNTMKNLSKSFVLLTLFVFVSMTARPHCEVPCGIYDDQLRIALIKEHIQTIKKAMTNINTLGEEGDKNYNQLIRWTDTKEVHANEIQHIVSQYFMTQRIKTEEADKANFEKNRKMLVHLHRMLVFAMKCKQSTDEEMTAKLLTEVEKFEAMYFEGHDHDH
jgi:nickel superoxide dismutase